MADEFVVVELRADDTAPLRRSVLRDGTLSDDVRFDGDRDPATFHLGVRQGDQLVAISTWMERPHPDHAGRLGYQLRGMATDPAHRGAGHGGRLLTAGVERCRAIGAEVVWARARETVLDFYLRRGFQPLGDGYVDATTGLPHRDVVTFLD